MAQRTFKSLGRALGRAQLLDVAALPECTVEVYAFHDALHTTYCPLGTSTSDRGVRFTLALADLLAEQALNVCDRCEGSLASLRGHHALAPDLNALLDLSELTGTATRLAANPGGVRPVGKITTLTHKMERQLSYAAALSTAPDYPPLAQARDRLVAAARDALVNLADAGRDPARVAAVTSRVLDELVPAHLRAAVTLEDDRVLIGITPHRATNKKVQDVINAFQVASTANSVTLSCPRFVADYLNRYYQAGGSWGYMAIISVTAGHLSEASARSAAMLWRPGTDTPMANLATAVHAIHLIEST